MKHKIRILSEKVKSLKETINTEESTKTAFILPLLQILGYDIFNPLELIPECHSDIGSKKGEKVDYCICLNQTPTIIIECKNWNEELNCHVNQLIRYYHTSKAKLSIQNVIDAYKLIHEEDESPYYVKPGDDTTLFNVYNAFTELISNDNDKDIFNKCEKTLLLRSILDF